MNRLIQVPTISYALAAHKATIVLPAFVRSCFADRGKKENPINLPVASF
jgi:hypothetical protein